MELSYWEYKSWLSDVDFTIAGSGIVGLNCALQLRARFPDARILILERGVLPQGASTKNAGFACFGSISEILDDLNSHSEEEVLELVGQRYSGIQYLRKLLGDNALGYREYGGHELFLDKDTSLYDLAHSELGNINRLMSPVFGKPPFESTANQFRFRNILPHYISNRQEGQIDTGRMMQSLLRMAYNSGIQILNATEITAYQDTGERVNIQTGLFDFQSHYFFIATNALAPTLMQQGLRPARAQVLITEPISELDIRGTFHLDRGYYYFRNIDNRILLGGGRNLDPEGETTHQFGTTTPIQQSLEKLLEEVILPGKKVRIDRRWSGIMGMGEQKKPIIKPLSNRVFCGVRLGGMGIAIGSHVGKGLANLLT